MCPPSLDVEDVAPPPELAEDSVAELVEEPGAPTEKPDEAPAPEEPAVKENAEEEEQEEQAEEEEEEEPDFPSHPDLPPPSPASKFGKTRVAKIAVV